jgi:hypothetical protein
MLARMRTRNIHVVGVFLGVVSTIAHAQCIEDTNGDGHPLFGSLFQRPDVELVDGELAAARATGVAFGDLDGDGDLDAVCTQAAQGVEQILDRTYLTVLFNLGDGVYGPPTLYKAGHEVVMPVLGDFDLDGDLDVAVTNARDDTVSILYNDGAGVLSGETTYATGTMPRSLVAEDFDADGDADLAVLAVGIDAVSVLSNNGDGTFEPHVLKIVGGVTDRKNPNPTFPVPGPFLAAGDLDGDRDVDLAIPCGGQVKIMVNDGAGGFSVAPETIDVIGQDVYDIVIGDLNGDGLADVATAMTKTPASAVNVALNEGGMTFADPVAYDGDLFGCPGCFYNYMSIDAGDIDNDGDLDIAAGTEFMPGFAVFRNRGDGSFGPVEMIESYQGPWVVKLHDVSGDGWLDSISLTTAVRSGMRINLNDGAGKLITPDHVATEGEQSEQHWRMVAGDIDGDGYLDVATVRGWSNVELFEGHPDGTFTFRGEVDVGEPADLYDVAMGDLNGDGLGDLVLADEGGLQGEPGAIWVALQTAPFEFDVLDPILLDDSQAYEVILGDIDADGDLDALSRLVGVYPGDDDTPVDRRVLVLANDGFGNLSPVQKLTFASHTYFILGAMALGDLDADGDLDAVACAGPTYTPGLLGVLMNDGTGTLSIESTMDVPAHPQSIQLRDFDADGSLDLALMCNHSPANPVILQQAYLMIAMNDGTGAFEFTQEFIDINSHSNGQLVAADFDNDDDIDLALPDNTGFIEVHFSDGAGAFGPGARYTGVDHTPALAGADVDADGRVDLIGANAYSAGLMIFRNRLCPPCPADVNADGVLNILDFVAFQQAFVNRDPAADCDDDGALDNPLDFVCFQQVFQAGCE